MENKSLTMIWTLIVALSLLSGFTQALSFSRNGYELTIAISEDAHRIADGDRRLFLQSLREIMTATSQSLFVATDNYYYFSKVNILIPPNWESTVAPSPVSVTNLHNYLNADMRVETTIERVEEGQSIPVKEIRTSNSKLCGHPGEYIIVPPCFFNSSCPEVNEYGDRAKALVREFAHYRYGVHDEHGFTDEGETKFPYTFVNTQGHTQITGCNNTEIKGSYRTNENIPCDYQTEPACRFRPNMTEPNGPTSSLLFMQFLPTVSKFCDSTTHDRSVPNKQNYWCRNRSVKTVMMQSPEFKNNKPNPLPPSANTVPQFNYFVRASQTVYIVMDTSSHTPINEAVFNYTKTQITQNLIPNLVTGSKRSFVGLATMGGTNVNLTNGQLTGYLTEIQSPIDISSSGNDQILKSKVNALTRSSGSGLLLEKAVLDIGDILTSYTYLSGSIVILVKLSDVTDTTTMSPEAEAVHLLNSRNIRLVSYEYNIDSNKNKILERTTSLTGGTHFPANSSNYQAVFTSAINKTLELLQVSAPFRNRRIQLTRDPFTSTNTKSYSGFFNIDFATGSVNNAEINFFIPAGRPSDYAISIAFRNTTYNINSEVHSQKYLSWDNKYKVHTYFFFSNGTGNGTFTVSTTGSESLSGYVEAIEIVDDNAPVYIGGGGVPSSKPVEIEVFTSGSGGILDMGSSTEDPSFLIYASVRKGYTAPTFLKSAEAIIHSPNSIFGSETISLRDDGLYPDLLEKDGIYTGFYKPTSSNDFRISLRLDGFRTSSPVLKTFDEDNSRSSLPEDQDNICCGSTYNKPRASYAFQRFILHGARLRARDLIFYDERPLRIMDFQIDEYDSENDNITFSWTSPQATYGNNNNSVDSYRLVYNSNSRLVVDDVSGLVPANPVTVLPADIINGSLDPLKPYERQSVSVILNYDTLTSNLVYFTIDSKRNGVFSYPSPMIFLKLNVTITTTVAPSTTTSAATTPSSTTTTRPTTTTTPTTTTRTTSTTSPTTTTRTTTTTTSTTTKKSSSQRVIASSFFSLFLIIISIFIFTC